MKYISKKQLADAQKAGLAVIKVDYHESNVTIVIICDNQGDVDKLLADDNRDCYSMSAAYWYDLYSGKFYKGMLAETYDEHTAIYPWSD